MDGGGGTVRMARMIEGGRGGADVSELLKQLYRKGRLLTMSKGNG